MAQETPLDPSRLWIGPVIKRSQGITDFVAGKLPGHDGLLGTARRVTEAAQQAERVAASMKNPLSPHRLPALFLGVALASFGIFVYWQFFHVSTLTLALPDRDASLLRGSAARASRVKVEIVDVPGSREAGAKLAAGEVDLGFVQGGVPVPPGLRRHEMPSRELVLFFVRERITSPTQVRRVVTSVEGEGSHSVGQAFAGAWGIADQVTWLHAFADVTGVEAKVLPEDVDAVFVVKDPGDDKSLLAVARLVGQGFRLVSPQLGARAGRFDWLSPMTLSTGFLQVSPPVPAEPVETFSVSTFLVAREGLTPARLTQAAALLDTNTGSIAEGSFRLSTDRASELLQGMDALLSILVNIGLAFLALLGLDVIAYRRQFHELNSLVSLLSLLQSQKDILGVSAEVRAEHRRYLATCSDLLSVISAITGYYTQENSSLLFNNLSEVVHQRCDGLKLNIQLKLLQGGTEA